MSQHVNALVVFPLSGYMPFSTQMQIAMSEFCHEVATVLLPEQGVGTDFQHGTPVVISWKDTGGHQGSWFGYVDTIQQSSSGSRTVAKAICVGTSYPLKEQRQDVWQNVTGDGVCESMAASWRLGVDLGSSPRVWPHLAQAGMSDWALLADLAHQIGFTLYTRGPLICFHERTREMDRLAQFAPVFFYLQSDVKRTLVSFSPTASGSYQANNRTQVTVLDNSGSAFQVANDDGTGTLLTTRDRLPSFTAVNTGVTATTSEAEQALIAQGEDSRFHVRATARVAGDARVRPAMPVYLGGLPSPWSGLWFVMSVTHTLAPANDDQGGANLYYCDLTLGRDGMGQSTGYPNYSDIQHTDEALAEIGPTGLWQCGPIPTLSTIEEAPPLFVTNRLAALRGTA